MAHYQVVGVYKVEPTKDSIRQAITYHGDNFLLDEKGEFADEIVWENLEDLALIELDLRDAFSPKELLTISQNDQAVYMEFYLDEDGLSLINEEQAISLQSRRLAFFLHFTDVSKPLTIADEDIKLPDMIKLPERLVPFAHYIPVD